MSNQQHHNRSPPPRLEVQSDVPDSHSDQATQSTTISEVQREATRNMRHFPRADLTGVSSSEPNPDSIPDLDTVASNISSAADLVSGNIPQSAFAGNVGDGRAQSSIQNTPDQFYFGYEANADRDRILREGVRHSRSVHSAFFDHTQLSNPTISLSSSPTSSAIPVEIAEKNGQERRGSQSEPTGAIMAAAHTPQPHIVTHAYLPSSPMLHGRVSSESQMHTWPELPPRPEPTARRLGARGWRLIESFVFRRGNVVHDEGTEMDAFDHASVRNPRSTGDRQAGRIRDWERERRRQDDALTEEQSHKWGVVVCGVAGVTAMTVIYALVKKFGTSE